MRDLVASIAAEFRRYKSLGDAAMAQLTDADFAALDGDAGNSVAVIVRHMSGNFASRFTDFLTTDGEKPSRDRDAEFVREAASRTRLMSEWDAGWKVLFAALTPLVDVDLARTVTIRGQALRVHEALHRSLAHASYHVGQIVHIAKLRRGADWRTLSIAPGQSAEYNRAPTLERPGALAEKLKGSPGA